MTNEQHEFWYSEKQEQSVRQHRMGRNEVHLNTFFKGKRYSEVTELGKRPSSMYDDFVHLGTGSMKDVTVKN